jgi:hypothetical protein
LAPVYQRDVLQYLENKLGSSHSATKLQTPIRESSLSTVTVKGKVYPVLPKKERPQVEVDANNAVHKAVTALKAFNEAHGLSYTKESGVVTKSGRNVPNSISKEVEILRKDLEESKAHLKEIKSRQQKPKASSSKANKSLN